jgi:hypothetical protein
MRATLMRYGHAPADIDDYPLRDCRVFMQALTLIRAQEWGALGDS